VLASDGAELIGYSPNAGRWGGWLMLDRILVHYDPHAGPYVYEDENAVRWANEAGRTPTSSAVEAVLNGDEVFAEDLFFQLLDVLGLPDLASGPVLDLQPPPERP
jgi:hypothetical protein